MITSIKQYKNIIINNKNHNKKYKSKEGVIVVEYENGNTSILDLQAQFDMTNAKHLEVEFTKNTKEKILFQDIDLENFENDN